MKADPAFPQKGMRRTGFFCFEFFRGKPGLFGKLFPFFIQLFEFRGNLCFLFA